MKLISLSEWTPDIGEEFIIQDEDGHFFFAEHVGNKVFECPWTGFEWSDKGVKAVAWAPLPIRYNYPT